MLLSPHRCLSWLVIQQQVAVQRCGMETVVLEARQEVGGRVCTQTCPGFSAPLDLGASIITGDSTHLLAMQGCPHSHSGTTWSKVAQG